MSKMPYVRLSVALLVLLTASVNLGAQENQLPRLPGEALLVGWGGPRLLGLTTATATLWVQPEEKQPDTQIGGALPSITRDGRVVAGVRLKSARPLRVAVATYFVAEKKWEEYSDGEFARSVAIAPDGSRLAFSGKCGDLACLHIVDLMSGSESVYPEITIVETLSWAPDGVRLAYVTWEPIVARPQAKPVLPRESLPTRPQINIFNAESRTATKIANGKAAVWSPSGEWIAYFDASGTRCMAIHPDGTGAKQLAVRRGGIHLLPVWSPDSTHLLLNGRLYEEGGMDIYMLDLATLQLTRKFTDKIPVLAWIDRK